MTPFGRKIGRTNDYTFAAREDFSSTLAKSHTRDRESRTYRGYGRGGRTADPVGSGGGKNAPFWAAFSTVYFGGFFRESHDPLKRTEDVSEADAPPGRGGTPPVRGTGAWPGRHPTNTVSRVPYGTTQQSLAVPWSHPDHIMIEGLDNRPDCSEARSGKQKF